MMYVSPIAIIIVVMLVVLGYLGLQKIDQPTENDDSTENVGLTEPERFEFEKAFSTVVDKIPNLAEKTEIYDGIFVSNNERVIDLSGRGLEGSLKAEIRHISSARVLNLSNNAFTGLPAEVGQLSHLETLNLENNLLTGLPHELGNLQNLRTLVLTGNDISKSDLAAIREALPPNVYILVD